MIFAWILLTSGSFFERLEENRNGRSWFELANFYDCGRNRETTGWWGRGKKEGMLYRHGQDPLKNLTRYVKEQAWNVISADDTGDKRDVEYYKAAPVRFLILNRFRCYREGCLKKQYKARRVSVEDGTGKSCPKAFRVWKLFKRADMVSSDRPFIHRSTF